MRPILLSCLFLWTLVGLIGCKATPPTQRKNMPLTLEGLLGTAGTPAAKKHKKEKDKWNIEDETAEDDEEEDEAVESVSERLVSFGGLFVAEFPEPWEVTASQDTAVVTLRREDEALPDVLIFSRRISPQMRVHPVNEIRSFQQLVDPGLGTSSLYPLFEIYLQREIQRQRGATKTIPIEGWDRCIAILSNPTGGEGLRFKTNKKKNIGVRWVGRSENDVFFRLTEYQGTWGERQLRKDCAAFFEAIRLLLPEEQQQAMGPIFEKAAERIQDVKDQKPAQSSSARAIIGTAVSATNQSTGVHIAIICRTEPHCTHSPKLKELILGLRAPTLEEKSQQNIEGPDAIGDHLKKSDISYSQDGNEAGKALIEQVFQSLQIREGAAPPEEEPSTDAVQSTTPEGADVQAMPELEEEPQAPTPIEAAEPAEPLEPLELADPAPAQPSTLGECRTQCNQLQGGARNACLRDCRNLPP